MNIKKMQQKMGSPCSFTCQQALKMGYFYWLWVKNLNHLHTEISFCYLKDTKFCLKTKASFIHITGHLIGYRKKMENYAEILANIMRKKVTIMWKRHQIIRKFLKLITVCCFLGFFKRIKYMLTYYREFNSFMTCLTLDRYFFVQSSFSIVFSLKLSNQALNQTRNGI